MFPYWKSYPSNPSSAPASFTDEAASEEAATLLLILETSFHAKGKISDPPLRLSRMKDLPAKEVELCECMCV
ncbi:hypothetical protein AAC387_Pa05g1088 [Persea americana]